MGPRPEGKALRKSYRSTVFAVHRCRKLMRKNNNACGWPGWLTALFMSVASLARAHDPGLSTAALKIFSDRLDAEVIFARADIEALVPLDANHDGKVSPEEWNRARPKLETLVRESLNVLVNEATVVISESSFHLDESNNFHMAGIFPAHGAKALTVESSLVKRLPRGHRQFVSLLDDKGVTLAEMLLSAEHDAIDVDLSKRLAEERPPAKTATFREFFVMGVEHILTGHDHLLFLFGLLIVMSQFRATVCVISCFTLAHSTTLALAAFDVVRVSDRVVEPLIAATIIYVGVENLLRLDGPTGRWRLTLVFGLVHGLGFATDLREKLAGVIGAQIAVPLLSFNLGVELGQMAVAALALPLIWWLRTEPVLVRRSVPVCSSLVALAGAWWLLQRTLLE
jgi:hydrogenase/urease accessory protein HupE